MEKEDSMQSTEVRGLKWEAKIRSEKPDDLTSRF